jgi:hypothetical protein
MEKMMEFFESVVLSASVAIFLVLVQISVRLRAIGMYVDIVIAQQTAVDLDAISSDLGTICDVVGDIQIDVRRLEEHLVPRQFDRCD